MFDQAIARVGIKYGVLCGIACFGILLLVYFLGNNPLGSAGQVSYLPIPIFIFLGLRYFKQFNDTEISFFRGWRVGFSVTFYTALTTALLLFLFIYTVGPDLLRETMEEMRMMLEANKEEQIRLFGKENYDMLMAESKNVTPGEVAVSDFFRRLLLGGLLSIVAAVFFRK
ncbi:DUF4199 domain-containing protein [Botryobacter ruber]|uniref:DUF4199 domain-containing protein n=1 Tax=Botryobacter ruber TaxID=2171629 RepID=UPI000E0BBF18|nr:DUF4199 domain-containing protein [Botryobacter ruber]